MASTTEQGHRRVVRWLARRRLVDPDDARDRLAWEHGGFSLDASVCIAGHDSAGLERLLRYCARPPFALEHIAQVPAGNGEQQVVYRLPKSLRDSRTQLTLTAMELIDHFAVLIPPPRLNRHHGVLAPNAPLRLAATACVRDADLGGAPPGRRGSQGDEGLDVWFWRKAKGQYHGYRRPGSNTSICRAAA